MMMNRSQDPDYPIIIISCRMWKRLGRNISDNFVLRRIRALWRPKGMIDNGLFLAKFSSMDDYEYAKFGE